MKHRLVLLLIISLIAISAPVLLAITNVKAAQSGRLDFGSPTWYSDRSKVGKYEMIYIYENSSTLASQCTKSTLYYTTSILQLSTMSSLEGVFGDDKERIYANGSPSQGISFAGSCSGDKKVSRSGHQEIARVIFKVIGEGKASIWFSSNSQVNGDTSPTLATMSITGYVDRCPQGYSGTPPNCTKNPDPKPDPPPPPPPPPPPKPTPTPTPKPEPTPQPTPNPSPAPSPQPAPAPWKNVKPAPPQLVNDPADPKKSSSKPTVKGDLIKNVSVISKLSSAQLTFEYNGNRSELAATYQTEFDDPTPVKISQNPKGIYEISLTGLDSLSKYLFRISGAQGASYEDTFYTLGYPVSVKVLDGGEPLADGEIVIENGSEPYTYTLDGKGIASIFARQGELTVSLASNSQRSQTFTVEALEGDDPKEQVFEFDISAVPKYEQHSQAGGKIGLLLAAIGAVILGAIGAVIFFFLKKKRQNATAEIEVPPDYLFPWEQTTQPTQPTSPSAAPGQPSPGQAVAPTNPVVMPPATPPPPAPLPNNGDLADLDIYEQAAREGRFNNL